MKPAIICALSALLLSACVEPGAAPDDTNEGVLAPATHDPAEAAQNDALDQAQPQLTAEATSLTSGVPVTGLAGAQGVQTSFTLEVPANASNLKFVLSGGTGDADLYVRRGTAPTTRSFDFRPFLDGNEETVEVPMPGAGTWHVMIRGYSAYTGVSLVASFAIATTPPPPPPVGGLDCTNAASWPAAWVALEDEVLVLVNQVRATGATCGGVAKGIVPPLVMDEKLRQAARCHSLDMARLNYFSHNSQDGRSPWDRIRNAGYTGFGNGENIAAGRNTAAGVMDQWMNSEGHCKNIMTDGSNEIGIGYGFDASSTYRHYWTQNLGRR